jgi:signal transduction histidine kinase
MQPPSTALLSKPDLPYADAIDTRLVFRIYAWVATTFGLFVYLSPPGDYPAIVIQPMGNLPATASRTLHFVLPRLAATVIVGAGVCAAGFMRIDDPVGRRRALVHFAIAHLVFGLLWLNLRANVFALPPIAGWFPLIVGAVLLYSGLTATTTMPMRRLVRHGLLSDTDPGRVEVHDVTYRVPVDALRSQYEEQIRRAARQEERARLARDLHDAVKQQLFVIQTAAATVQNRFETDVQGAKAAVEQVRTAAREAAVEMQALIEELQASPMENVGLVEALKKQCDALEFRSGAEVKLNVGELPASQALPPGAQPALFRAAQEALANIGRHARAQHVDVTIGMSGDCLELAIRDDGAGFEPDEAKGGMGLRNIAARIAEVGGSFALHSRPGSGTSIRLSVPCYPVSHRRYGRIALAWAAVLAVMLGLSAVQGRILDRPLSLAAIAIAGVIVTRYVAAYYRLRRRRMSP